MNCLVSKWKSSPTTKLSIAPKQLNILLSIADRIKFGTMDVQLPDGRFMRVEGDLPGPNGKIHIHNPQFSRRLLMEGALSFGEMYMDGWWSTPELQDVLDVIVLNHQTVGRRLPGAGLLRIRERLRHFLKANSKEGSRRNIAYHYDLGNDFYQLWLDQTMTYSSALFKDKDDSLKKAQENKFAVICDRLNCSPQKQILEIGCGWGGFAEYAIRERGLHVTGLTLSKQQKDFAQQKLFKAGLAERANIVMRDYRDEHGTYDGIVSIEMIEAVGEKYWPLYFKSLRDRLQPGCRAVLQAITIADSLYPKYRKGADFFQKHIFPGGMLMSPEVMRAQAAAVNLKAIHADSLADSYSRTLQTWRHQFNASWKMIAKLGFDERFRRMWNFYLAASAAGFSAGTIDVVQVSYYR